MRSDDRRPPEAEEFHAAWRTKDIPALLDLLFRTPTGWTIIAFALTIAALLIVVSAAVVSPGPHARAPQEAEIDLRREGCINCPVQAATPPQTWVTTDDYPASAQRAGEQGVTALSMIVGTNGRLSACSVTQASGSTALDRAACRALTARARYFPATDGNGQPIEATVTRRVRWMLPPER